MKIIDFRRASEYFRTLTKRTDSGNSQYGGLLI